MYLFVDCETTGLPHGGGYLSHDIIQLGCVLADDKLKVIATANWFCKPMSPHHWTEGAEEVHQIPLYKAMTFPDQSKVIKEFNQFTRGLSQAIWVEHSLNWIDWLFTVGMFLKNDNYYDLIPKFRSEKISTIKLAREHGYTGNSADEWAKRLGVADKFEHHNALHDAIVCYKIFKFLMEEK